MEVRDKRGAGEGTSSGATQGTAQRDLDFGWFTLPETSAGRAASAASSQQGKQPTGKHPTSDDPESGRSEGEPEPYNYSDTAHNGGACPSTSAQGAGDRVDRQCSPMMKFLGDDEGIGGSQDGAMQGRECFDTVVVNWPLSSVGLEQVRRLKTSASENQLRPSSARPRTAGQQQVSATPLPPLSWQGYRDTARPTYQSWREEWRTSQGRPGAGEHRPEVESERFLPHDLNNNANDLDGDEDDNVELTHDRFIASDIDIVKTEGGESSEEEFNNCQIVQNDLPDPDRDSNDRPSDDQDTDGGQRTREVGRRFSFLNINTEKRERLSPSPGQALRETSMTSIAKSVMKWSCWPSSTKSKSKGDKVKLLRYMKLAESDDDTNGNEADWPHAYAYSSHSKGTTQGQTN